MKKKIILWAIGTIGFISLMWPLLCWMRDVLKDHGYVLGASEG